MNKRGYIRTLEAVIAIIIILVFVFTVLQPKYKKESEPAEIKLLQDTIINELEENDNYRYYILTGDQTGIDGIKDYIDDMIGEVGDYEDYLHIQESNEPLAIPTLPEEVKIYAKGIMVSATLESGYNPKIVVLYLWEDNEV
jgi:hypothetical protein